MCAMRNAQTTFRRAMDVRSKADSDGRFRRSAKSALGRDLTTRLMFSFRREIDGPFRQLLDRMGRLLCNVNTAHRRCCQPPAGKRCGLAQSPSV